MGAEILKKSKTSCSAVGYVMLFYTIVSHNYLLLSLFSLGLISIIINVLHSFPQ